MNYGRESVRKKRKQLISKGTAYRKKAAVILLAVVLVLAAAAIVYVGWMGYSYVEDVLARAPEIDEMDAIPTGYMSTVLDKDGNVTAELVESGSNRVYVTLDQIPDNLQKAFVAIEDERFYEHNGIDLKGIVRAGIRGIQKMRFDEGASTITQQLLKNNVFEGWTEETGAERVERKLQEQYLAVQLEKKVSKDWIMENYLNTINLGQNTLGVQAAARRYFGKDVSDLTLSECAAIAGITKNPYRYNPVSYPDNNKARRNLVLNNMLDQGYISEQEYEEALEDDIYKRIGSVNAKVTESSANVTSYFVDSLIDDVIRDLQEELGYSEAEAYKALYSGGLTICSTQDPDIQEICDREINEPDNYDCPRKVSFAYALSIQQKDGSVENFNEQTMLQYEKERTGNDSFSINYDSREEADAAIEDYKEHLLEDGGKVIGENLTYTIQPQASMTVIDQKTGRVKAIVGGRGDKAASRTWNRASAMTRQPGSTFKILTAYAPALEHGDGYTLAKSVRDEPIQYSNGKSVRNASRTYRGYTTIRDAIKYSINTIAVKTIWDITPAAGYDMAKEFGITTLSENDAVEALPLGGVQYGVTNLELTAAYASIANGGVYREPILYTKILDHNGEVLLKNKSEKRRVIRDSTAFLLTSAMEGVVSSGGTGAAAAFDGMSIAGKTGTAGSSGASRDAWFVGFTPYYTCAVWGGYDDYSELPSTLYPKTIWRNAMRILHEGKEDTGFPAPEDVHRQAVCRRSGKLALDGVCPSVYSEYFADGTEPSETCDLHITAKICKVTGLLAGEDCPAESVEERVFVRGSEKKEEKMPEKVCDLHRLLAPLTGEIPEGVIPEGETVEGDIPVPQEETEPENPGPADKADSPDTPDDPSEEDSPEESTGTGDAGDTPAAAETEDPSAIP